MKSLERRMLLGVVLGFLLPLGLYGQGRVHSKAITKNVGNSYYLRYSIYKHKEHLPRVFANKIVNLRLEDCGAADRFYPYESLKDVMYKGDQVRILAFQKHREGMLVTFEHVRGKAGTLSTKPFECVLCGDKSTNISNAFKFLFSRTKVSKTKNGKDSAKNLKTKQKLIELYGFPVLICGTGLEETWYYNYVYTQHGYDQMWFSVKSGNVKLVRWQN
jgi:hypothetical protein